MELISCSVASLIAGGRRSEDGVQESVPTVDYAGAQLPNSGHQAW